MFAGQSISELRYWVLRTEFKFFSILQVEIPFACLHKTPLLEGWFRLLPLGNHEVDTRWEFWVPLVIRRGEFVQTFALGIICVLNESRMQSAFSSRRSEVWNGLWLHLFLEIILEQRRQAEVMWIIEKRSDRKWLTIWKREQPVITSFWFVGINPSFSLLAVEIQQHLVFVLLIYLDKLKVHF